MGSGKWEFEIANLKLKMEKAEMEKAWGVVPERLLAHGPYTVFHG